MPQNNTESTNITAGAVIKVGQLSRLSSSPSSQFVKKYTDDLQGVLSAIKTLEEVDTTDIDPLESARTMSINDLRQDIKVEEKATYDRIKNNIINNFPRKQGNLLILPGIFDE